MCMHWQAAANEKLKKRLKTMTDKERKEELENNEKSLIEWTEKSAKFNSRPDINQPIGRHIGIFKGMIFSCELSIDTIKKYIAGEDQVTIPPNTIILRS